MHCTRAPSQVSLYSEPVVNKYIIHYGRHVGMSAWGCEWVLKWHALSNQSYQS